MKSAILLVLAISLASGAAQAARKPCDELKAEIEANLQANGVQNYLLEAVANEAVGERRVVGSCDGGTQKIVYTREGAAATPPPSEPAPPLDNY